MIGTSDFDKQKMLDHLVDPNVSVILAELEDGAKTSAHLAGKLHIPESEIRERLSYSIEHGFVLISPDSGNMTFSVDHEKLDKIMQSDENFSGIVEGMTELDQFLN